MIAGMGGDGERQVGSPFLRHALILPFRALRGSSALNTRSTAVVIVNYRTAGLVVDCLRTLVGEVAAEPGLRVVVVDNASGDDSVRVIGDAIRDFVDTTG